MPSSVWFVGAIIRTVVRKQLTEAVTITKRKESKNKNKKNLRKTAKRKQERCRFSQQPQFGVAQLPRVVPWGSRVWGKRSQATLSPFSCFPSHPKVEGGPVTRDLWSMRGNATTREVNPTTCFSSIAVLADSSHINWQRRATSKRGPQLLNPPCCSARTTQKQYPPAESLHTIDSLPSSLPAETHTARTMAVGMEPFPRKSREQSPATHHIGHKPRLGLR